MMQPNRPEGPEEMVAKSEYREQPTNASAARPETGQADAMLIPAELVQRLRSKDEDAWGEIFDRFASRLYNLMRRLGHDPATADDLVQETFFKAFRFAGTIQDEKAFIAWLFQIAVNTSKGYCRKNWHNSEATMKIDPVDSTEDPVHQLTHEETLEGLRRAISRLKPKLRGPLVLHRIEGLTIAECAKILQVREGTVKSRVYRAEVALEGMMAAEAETEHRRQAADVGETRHGRQVVEPEKIEDGRRAIGTGKIELGQQTVESDEIGYERQTIDERETEHGKQAVA